MDMDLIAVFTKSIKCSSLIASLYKDLYFDKNRGNMDLRFPLRMMTTLLIDKGQQHLDNIEVMKTSLKHITYLLTVYSLTSLCSAATALSTEPEESNSLLGQQPSSLVTSNRRSTTRNCPSISEKVDPRKSEQIADSSKDTEKDSQSKSGE